MRIYYQGSADLAGDAELQAWWADVKEGHKDKAEGWPEPRGTEVGMGSAAECWVVYLSAAMRWMCMLSC